MINLEMYGGQMVFTQEGDSCEGGIQQLDVSVDDAGGGKFMRIKTANWSFDKPEDFLAILQKVQKAFEIVPTTNKEE